MIVLDTSPLCYLLLIDEIEILPALFEDLVAPPSVLAELRAPGAPERVRAWAADSPPWLRIVEPPPLEVSWPARLGPGEQGVLALGAGTPGSVVILDERAARNAAQGLNLRVIGLLGVLNLAAARGLLDLPAALLRLQKTNFRSSPALLASLLRRWTVE